MNLDEWVAFLEPQLEGKTPEGVVIPARGAALCMSSEDYQKIKTALEQACYKLGHWCSKETKVEGEKASTRLTDLQSRVMEKKKEK